MFVAWTTGDAVTVGSDAEAASLLNHTFHASTVHSCAVCPARLPASSSTDAWACCKACLLPSLKAHGADIAGSSRCAGLCALCACCLS